MMTVEKARKHLPKEVSAKMSDDDVKALLADAYTFANFVVNDYLRSKRAKTNDKRENR